jgi:hypothetical protein
VVYSLQKVGKMEKTGTGYEREMTAAAQPGTRIVAFVERGEVGRVTAAGEGRM